MGKCQDACDKKVNKKWKFAVWMGTGCGRKGVESSAVEWGRKIGKLRGSPSKIKYL